jgi:hypothetical protein
MNKTVVRWIVIAQCIAAAAAAAAFSFVVPVHSRLDVIR